MAIIEGGYSAAEAEFALRIEHMPVGPTVTLEEAAEAIGQIRLGIEAAGSPYAEINAHGPAVTVSDFGNNMGLVLGSEISRAEVEHAFNSTVSSFLNGELVGTGVAASPIGGPFEAARVLFEMAKHHGLPIATGQWISTGAITGGHPVGPADEFQVRLGDLATACRFESVR